MGFHNSSIHRQHVLDVSTDKRVTIRGRTDKHEFVRGQYVEDVTLFAS